MRRIRLLAAVCFSLCAGLFAQDLSDKAEYDKAKAHAIELAKAQNFLAALPEFQKLVDQNPKDVPVVEGLAFCLMTGAENTKDPDARKNGFEEALKYANAAKALGDNSELLLYMIEKVKTDSTPAVFSEKEQVNTLIQQGEEAFAKGKLEEAKAAYQQALLIEPNNYAANLYLGDVYFKQEQYGSSVQWFQKATEIDPDRDPAFRYWGDALEKLNQRADARKLFIQAVIAQPYSNNTWRHLQIWAKNQGSDLMVPQIKTPGSVVTGSDNKVNITLDAGSIGAKDGRSAWMMYSVIRAAWQQELFKKEFPAESKYRHSLKEEAAALEIVVQSVAKDKSIKKMDPQIAMLVKLSNAGLLEPYILLNAADQGIAQDYVEYCKAHRDLLYKYLDTMVVPPAK